MDFGMNTVNTQYFTNCWIFSDEILCVPSNIYDKCLSYVQYLCFMLVYDAKGVRIFPFYSQVRHLIEDFEVFKKKKVECSIAALTSFKEFPIISRKKIFMADPFSKNWFTYLK